MSLLGFHLECLWIRLLNLDIEEKLQIQESACLFMFRFWGSSSGFGVPSLGFLWVSGFFGKVNKHFWGIFWQSGPATTSLSSINQFLFQRPPVNESFISPLKQHREGLFSLTSSNVNKNCSKTPSPSRMMKQSVCKNVGNLLLMTSEIKTTKSLFSRR
uniref:Uncharacterized protein n=1 Tax=Meloidogyne enterolobii TaxID=390850 RepID=A0A6V7Y2S3_MELEN|nr:unnamed protein product [Meloidogyne enterolobii]